MPRQTYYIYKLNSNNDYQCSTFIAFCRMCDESTDYTNNKKISVNEERLRFEKKFNKIKNNITKIKMKLNDNEFIALCLFNYIVGYTLCDWCDNGALIVTLKDGIIPLKFYKIMQSIFIIFFLYE